jgi:hypothetical protein
MATKRHRVGKGKKRVWSIVEIRHSGASRPVYTSVPLQHDAAESLALRKRAEADRMGWNVHVDVVPVGVE